MSTQQADPDRLDFFSEGIGYGADVDPVVNAAVGCAGDPWTDRKFLARVVAALADQSNVPPAVVDAVALLLSEANTAKAILMAKRVQRGLR